MSATNWTHLGMTLHRSAGATSRQSRSVRIGRSTAAGSRWKRQLCRGRHLIAVAESRCARRKQRPGGAANRTGSATGLMCSNPSAPPKVLSATSPCGYRLTGFPGCTGCPPEATSRGSMTERTHRRFARCPDSPILISRPPVAVRRRRYPALSFRSRWQRATRLPKVKPWLSLRR